MEEAAEAFAHAPNRGTGAQNSCHFSWVASLFIIDMETTLLTSNESCRYADNDLIPVASFVPLLARSLLGSDRSLLPPRVVPMVETNLVFILQDFASRNYSSQCKIL
jgi:hypothetical protein